MNKTKQTTNKCINLSQQKKRLCGERALRENDTKKKHYKQAAAEK